MSLNLTKRGKIWHYSGTIAGRRLRGTTGATEKTTAQRIASQIETDAWASRLDAPEERLTMAQAFMAYRDAEKPTRFLELLEDHWKDTLVRTVTSGAIRQAAITLYPDAKPATRNRQAIVPTVAAINHAASLEWCKRIKVERFKVQTRPKRPVTGAWASAFQAEASPHMGALCRFMYESGARLGEAVSLVWGDVDLERRQIVIGRTKNNEGRMARVTPNILTALANLPSNRNAEDRVFRYFDGQNVGQTWDGVIKRAGIERLTPHSCRHGFATTMLRAGVDVKTVAKWGGWKDTRVLLDTYAHAIEDGAVIDDVFGTELTQGDNAKTLSHSNKREKTA